MKGTKFIKGLTEEAIDPNVSIELLKDPVRSKILFEIVLKGVVTVKYLLKSTGKSRSTLSHHLKKLVEAGILEVLMKPTGKIKHYKITSELEKFMYSTDSESLAKGTLEEKSNYIIGLYQMFSIMNNTYTNLFNDQLQNLDTKKPFNNIDIRADERIFFDATKKRRVETPYFTFFITGDKQAQFLRNKLKEVMKDFSKEFSSMPDIETALSSPEKSIVSLQILPYINFEEA